MAKVRENRTENQENTKETKAKGNVSSKFEKIIALASLNSKIKIIENSIKSNPYGTSEKLVRAERIKFAGILRQTYDDFVNYLKESK